MPQHFKVALFRQNEHPTPEQVVEQAEVGHGPKCMIARRLLLYEIDTGCSFAVR
jgi:hypothetical protein